MSAAGRPAVSVIIPCYNLGRYVEEAIDSVLAQTFRDVEIVVVNDGSTDPHTNQVLAGLRRPRTTVLETENRGLPAARNHAIAHAGGRYICALDADDRLHPEFLAKTVAVLERDPTVAFASTWIQCFGTEEWIWRQERCDFPTLLAECVVLTASPVRRQALEAVGGYDSERYLYGSEDWDLWISLVERGFRGAIVPEVLFYYRQREGSMRRLGSAPETRMRVWRTLLDKHRASYERHLPDVLLRLEEDCGRLLHDNARLELELETRLAPLVAQRTAERDRLRAAPAGGGGDALAAARAEVAALRGSWSWKVTAPLRRGYDGWLAVRRRLGARDAG